MLLYIATDAPVRLGASGKLSVEEVKPEILDDLRAVFSKPSIRYVGVEGSCSCDFRHVLAEEAAVDFDGMFDHEDDEERAQAATVLSQLLDLVQDQVQSGLELYPTWAGEQLNKPKGARTVTAAETRPERFFFIEGFLYTFAPRGSDPG
ncbi:MAG TPA: hypothetical protein VFZ65_19290 [Planctomycetota bacterium]|nr:hypothetical protein [Planctomycetota bacterium]